eukprot:g9130.t1
MKILQVWPAHVLRGRWKFARADSHLFPFVLPSHVCAWHQIILSFFFSQASVIMSTLCSQCNELIPASSDFCGECGTAKPK